MGYVKGLTCLECGREYPVSPLSVCEFCFGPVDVAYDYKTIKKILTKKKIEKRAENLWRYRDLLPVDGALQAGLNSGFTPLLKADKLAKEPGVKTLFIKDRDDISIFPAIAGEQKRRG
jgi:threonine synthase